MVQAGSHIELRKRNEAFKARAGKKAPLKVVDPLDKKKPVARKIVYLFLALLMGGLLFELLQLVVNAISPPAPLKVKTSKGGFRPF